MRSKEIKNLIRKKLKLRKVNDKFDLFLNNIIDSLIIVDLVGYINTNLKLKCNINKISHENFSSIDKILKFLKRNNKNIK